MAETTPSLLEQINAVARTSLAKNNYVEQGALGKYDALKESFAGRAAQYARKQEMPGFAELREQAKNQNLSDEELTQVSRAMAVESIVLNAVRYATDAKEQKDAAGRDKDPLQQKIAGALDEITRLDTDGQTLKEAIEKSIISLVHTSHPTIYHTRAAKSFEKELATLLETPGNVYAAAGKNELTKAGQEAVAKLFSQKDGFIEKLTSGKAFITPQKPMTVQEESQMEEENWAAIKARIGEVIATWNAAVTAKNCPDLIIDETQRQRMFELRSWGNGADADGREKSTSLFLHESIQRKVKDGQYTGEMLDLRQNAEQHRDLISALIQKEYQHNAEKRYGETGSFIDFCKEFMEQPVHRPGLCDDDETCPRKNQYRNSPEDSGDPKKHIWSGTEDSIFQQLTPEDQADFIEQMFAREDRLIPSCVMEDAVEGAKAIANLKKQFIEAYPMAAMSIRLRGYEPPEIIPYEEMIHISVPFVKPGAEPGTDTTYVSLRGAFDHMLKKNGWELYNSGRNFMRLPERADPNAPFDITSISEPDRIRMNNALHGTRKLIEKRNEDGSLKEYRLDRIGSEERSTLMETVKRLAVVKDARKNHGGDKVVNRYQIANFSSAADFMVAMKLFEETGLVEVERNNGKATIKKADLDIHPLLETEEDLANAPAIFKKLLESDLTRSYWAARGDRATIMLGFSDGAASAGNFASQWAIYKASRELTEIFASHGIKVEFFQGRGRGTDRGGTIDPSLQFDLMPPEATCHGRYDVTIQSDLPMDMAASPAYGRNYLADVLLGNLKSYVKYKEVRERLSNPQTAITTNRDEREGTITAIADKASEIYQRIVSKNPDTLKFLNAMPDNPFKSSRATARAGATVFKEFDKVRAIPKEYLANTADLPFHNVGLGAALKDHLSQIGEKKLNEHPFFSSMLATVDAGMVNSDPQLATEYGKITKTENFVGEVVKDLGVLGYQARSGTLSKLLPSLADPAKRPGNGTASIANGMDQLSHALILNALESGKPAKPDIVQQDQKKWFGTLSNLIFTSAQETGHRQLAKQQQTGAGMAA